jgi:hypothetical protein
MQVEFTEHMKITQNNNHPVCGISGTQEAWKLPNIKRIVSVDFLHNLEERLSVVIKMAEFLLPKKSSSFKFWPQDMMSSQR